MRIRIAKADDLPEIVKLEQQAAEAAHWSPQQYDVIFSSDCPRRLVWVAEDGELQGFLAALIGRHEWELENIAVARRARRCGLGGQLLRELIGRARTEGAEAIFLEVRESNQAARSLYEKSGFREAGWRQNYYREPQEAAVIYRYSLV
jgi:ribosomal-protein-alanine acetyltransferase